jgi:hypothetical protein
MKSKLLAKALMLLPLFGFSQTEYTFTNGGGDLKWETATNWNPSGPPGATDDATIIDYEVTIETSNIVINDLLVRRNDDDADFLIKKTGSLTINGDLTLVGAMFEVNSDSNQFGSLITNGNIVYSSSSIIYNRWVNGVNNGTPVNDGWDLIGSPINNIPLTNLIHPLTGDPDFATNGSNPTTYALGYMDNSTNPVSWTNYNSNTNSGNLINAKGYQMATSNGATIKFIGEANRTNQTIAITNNNPGDSPSNTGLSGSRWNLVANPFPSYIRANSNGDTNNSNTDNFFSVNSSLFHTSWGAIYGFDGNGGHVVINNSSNNTYLAPGQGFFMASVGTGGTISFNTNMRTNTGGDDFISGRLANSSKEFYLRLYEDDNSVDYNKFYFDNGLSLGLDTGFDAGAFDQNISISSRLVEEDEGINFIFNAMGLSALDEETVIPLVLNRDAGVEFSISFEDSTIPEDVGVYLEDTLLETLTDLRSENFTLTPESDLSDMGRFYLRIGNTSLGGNDLDESYISIYKAASDDFVTIEGLSNVEKANVQLFNIIGQEVLNKTLKSNQSTQRVSTSGLTTGVYVIRLQADSSVIAKKIIIN